MENSVLAIKYLNEDNNVRESFFKLLQIKQKNAQYIYNVIYKILEEENLLKKLIAIYPVIVKVR